MKKSLEERFWEKVSIGEPEECWEWLGGKYMGGYGQFWEGSKYTSSHRMSYILENGSIPENMEVCHWCNNPGCVNPKHLYSDTTSGNMQYRKACGRQDDRTGEKNCKAKLTEDEVLEIREQASIGESRKSLSDRYNVSKENICLIVGRKTWTHI